MITSLAVYAMFHILPRNQVQLVVPAFVMIYMTLGHLHRQYINYLGWDLDFTGAQMVCLWWLFECFLSLKSPIFASASTWIASLLLQVITQKLYMMVCWDQNYLTRNTDIVFRPSLVLTQKMSCLTNRPTTFTMETSWLEERRTVQLKNARSMRWKMSLTSSNTSDTLSASPTFWLVPLLNFPRIGMPAMEAYFTLLMASLVETSPASSGLHWSPFLKV